MKIAKTNGACPDLFATDIEKFYSGKLQGNTEIPDDGFF